MTETREAQLNLRLEAHQRQIRELQRIIADAERDLAELREALRDVWDQVHADQELLDLDGDDL